MLFLSLRRLSTPSSPTFIQSASYITSRKNRIIPNPTDEPTRNVNHSTRIASKAGIEQVTNILDKASSSGFRVGSKFERTRRERLPKDQRFLKPTDLLPREDPFRRKRALLGPGAAESRRNDWFYQLDIDPLYEATNPRLLSYFVTDMGKVKSRAETKLTWRNQRRVTKAIRRAKMMGVMPILNKQISMYFKDASW